MSLIAFQSISRISVSPVDFNEAVTPETTHTVVAALSYRLPRIPLTHARAKTEMKVDHLIHSVFQGE